VQEIVGYVEVTLHALWPIAKYLIKKHGPKEPNAIYGPLGLKPYPLQKANAIAACLENQFKTP
jgi:hypothetical protein